MIEAMKQALEALEDVGVLTDREWQAVHKNKANELRQAIRERALYEVQRLGQEIEQEPVAWRTFDGEGGYDYRSYEDNESYADEWDKRNPNHKGWVDKLYTTPPPCPTCEALARTVMMDQTGRDA